MLPAVVAAMTLGIAGTAIPMATAGGGGGLHYVKEATVVGANSQARVLAYCPAGERIVGGGATSSADFSNASGMMINTSAPFDSADADGRPDDGWIGKVDVFQNAGGEIFRVIAICKG